MGKYFGTDGFRGEAGITLTADHAYKVGRFLGWYYNALRERNGNNEPARIVIGKDTRRSSYMFEYSLVAGLTASGADAYLLHVTTTPSVAYIARVDDFDCGIMISASHNPYYDNGIKLIDCYGEKMPEEILLLVEDYIDGKLHVFDKDWPELPFAHREHIGCTVDYVSGRNRYMGYLIASESTLLRASRLVWTAPTVVHGTSLSLCSMRWVLTPTSSMHSPTVRISITMLDLLTLRACRSSW